MIYADPLARASFPTSINTGHASVASGANNVLAQSVPLLGVAVLMVEAVCTNAAGASTSGSFTFKDSAGTILVVKVTGKVPVLGDRYVWEFPVPLVDGSSAIATIAIFLGPTMGTWDVSSSGFHFPSI